MSMTEIIVKDGNTYTLSTAWINEENSLGIVKARLKEYSIYKAEEPEIFIGKLYKTKEGNWYDKPDTTRINPLLSTFLKMAIDEHENANTPIGPDHFPAFEQH